MKNITHYTYNEIVEFAKNRKKHRNCYGNSSKNAGFSYSQTKSFEEAYDFAINGWDLGLEAMKISDGVLENGSTIMNPSLAGCLPHVQNYVMGFPEQMYNLYDESTYNQPTLDIFVNLVYTMSINSSDTIKFSKDLVAFINKKSASNNVRIIGVLSNKMGSVETYDFIVLKDFDSALVINNIAFAFHPSFFRRIWLSKLESLSNWESGYGRLANNFLSVVLNEFDTNGSDEVIIFKGMNNRVYNFDENTLDSVTYSSDEIRRAKY